MPAARRPYPPGALAAIQGDQQQHPWPFLLWSAARFGEAAALMPDVVNEQRQLAVLRHAVAQLPVQFRDPEQPEVWWEIKDPKHQESWHTTPLSLPALAALRDHRV